jgi:hypothetical protein
MEKINQWSQKHNISKNDINLHKKYLLEYSNKINIFQKSFLSSKELLEIWQTMPKNCENDIKGRFPTLRLYNNQKLIENLKKKLLDYYKFPLTIHIDNCNVCFIPEPTRPHIDGHFPFYPNDEREFCVLKIGVIPLAFDTEELSTDTISSTLITFKEHYEYSYGGVEFQEDFYGKTNYDNFDFFDKFFNALPKNTDPWIGDDDSWNHILAIPGMETGLHIENIYQMQLGDLVTFNPYQAHCTQGYSKITSKYVFRFLICGKLDE